MADGDGGGSDGGGSDGGGSEGGADSGGGGSSDGGAGTGSAGGSSGGGDQNSGGDQSNGGDQSSGGDAGSDAAGGASDSSDSSGPDSTASDRSVDGQTDSATSDGSQTSATDNGGSADASDPADSSSAASQPALSDSGTDSAVAGNEPTDIAAGPTSSDIGSTGASSTDASSTDASSTDASSTDDGSFVDAGAPNNPGPSGFTVSPDGLDQVADSFSGLVADGRSLQGDFGTLGLNSSVFGGIGGPVAEASAALGDGQLAAVDRALAAFSATGEGIGLSSASYRDADDQVSYSLAGLLGPTADQSVDGTLSDAAPPMPGLPAFAAPTPDEAAALATLDAQDFPATPGLPTFATLPAEEAAAVDALNAQDLAAPVSLADDPTMQAQLIAHEAARNHVYNDQFGHPTVGIGFNLDRAGARDAITAVGADYDAVRAGTQDLTNDQMTQLAHTDTQHAVDVARSYYDGFDQLDPARQRALVDMSFDLDGKINQFTGLHQALVNGDYNAAANHIATSLFARQTGDRGVDLTNQMRNGGQ